MNLFPSDPLNILPMDGPSIYLGPILDPTQTEYYFSMLEQKLDWKHDEANMFGKHFITKRMVAWYGDEEFEYTYSKITKRARMWTSQLAALKELVEEKSGQTFNSCLANLYHDGSEGMGWHSDNEKNLSPGGTIASLSLGAERRFSFKHKETKETVSITLENGSLLLMQGRTQEKWMHRLPPTKACRTARINLTFRTILHEK